MGNSNSSNNNGINISNLFDINKISKMFGNSRGNNPLSMIGKIFGNNNSRPMMPRCNVKVLPIEEAYRRIKNGSVLLIDVRTEMEYATIRIKGSINVPLDKLQQMIPAIVTNKEEAIMLHCSTGSRVRRAIQILWSMGYTNIYIWEGAGLNTFAFQDLIIYSNNRFMDNCYADNMQKSNEKDIVEDK